MKNLLITMLILSSCTQQEIAGVKRIAVAGGVGYLTGSQAGAITAAVSELQRTSAKSPRNVQPRR